MSHPTFLVSRFKNRNGVFSWRVDGRLNGVRIRRNFKTQEEAAAEKAALEIKALQLASNLHAVTTTLSTDQVREAETAFRRLADRKRSLSFYVDFALANHCEPEQQKPLAGAVDAYVAMKVQEHARKLISPSQLITIQRHMKVLKKHFLSLTVGELTPARLTPYFQRGEACLKTYNNRRGVVSTFLKFAEQQEWITTNPIKKVPHHRIARRRGSAKTITAAQAQELMAYVETYQRGRLVPFFALCLFAGIRPCLRTGEILRLKPEHVRLDTGVIRIEPDVSKVQELRTVAIQPNLAAWLRAYPLKKFPIIIRNLQKFRAKIAKRFGLTHDVMRHTFISMHVAKFRSLGEAALQAGNSESIIKKHYLDLKSPEEAAQFFGIMPTRTGGAPAGP
ncbi:MAG: site-specific integrase [Verrucomicrobia bacterium]|nr:site-specific integrase [Verrucomicrobiota bacterium]